jgi:hypothetical protein
MWEKSGFRGHKLNLYQWQTWAAKNENNNKATKHTNIFFSFISGNPALRTQGK